MNPEAAKAAEAAAAKEAAAKAAAAAARPRIIPYGDLEQGETYKRAEHRLSPQEETERRLNEGSIRGGFEERMKQIRFFDEWVKGGRKKDHPTTSPDEERMLALINNKGEKVMKKDLGGYFIDFRNWVNVILKNSKQNLGGLELSKDAYEAFKILKNLKVKTLWENREVSLQTLERLGFLEYFPEDAKFLNHDKEKDSSGQPVTLEGTMKCIVEQYSNEGYETGGKHELVDKHGRFNLPNFILWTRRQMILGSQFSPTSDYDPLLDHNVGITFQAGWSPVSIFDALFTNKHTRCREFVISGELGKISADWSSLMEHPMMNEKIREEILTQIWKTGLEQKHWAHGHTEAYLKDVQKGYEVFASQFSGNNGSRYKILVDALMMTANGVDDAAKILQNSERGTLGRAYSDGIAFFRHLTEMTDFYFDKKTNRVRDIKDNMAYKQLGPVGLSYFFQSIVENSFDCRNTLGNDIKLRYKDFLYEIMDELGESALKQASSEEHSTIDNLLKLAKKDLYDTELKDLSVNFEKNENLIELWHLLQQHVLGKEVTSQEHMDKYGLSGNEFVTFEGIERYVQLKMRKRLSGFLESILDAKSTIGRRLGDMEVYIVDGRIVNEQECRKAMRIGKNGSIPNIFDSGSDSGRVAISDIMSDFIDNYAGDMRALEIIKKYEERKAKGNLYDYVVDEDDAKTLYEDDGYSSDAETVDGDWEPESEPDKQAYLNAMSRIEEMHKRQERLAFAMLDKVANLTRKDLNLFRSRMPSTNAKNILLESLKKSFMGKYDLNHYEADYLCKLRLWYSLATLGIDAWNNTSTSRTAIHPLAALVRYLQYQLSDGSLSSLNHPGSILALLPPTLLDSCMLEVEGRKITLMEFMQGDYDLDEASLSYQFQGAFAEVMRRGVIVKEFLDTKEMILNANFLTTNVHGFPVLNHQELEKRLSEMYDAVQHLFNNLNLNYKDVISVDGEKKTLLEHMFSKKAIKSIEITKKYYENKANSWWDPSLSKRDREIYARYAKEIDQKPGVAIFMSIVMDAIRERTRLNGHHGLQDISDIKNLRWMFKHFMKGTDDGNPAIDGVREMPSLMPDGLFDRLLALHGPSMEVLSLREKVYYTGVAVGSMPKHLVAAH